MSLRRRYCAAKAFAEFLHGVQNNAELWRALAKRVQVPPEVVERVRALAAAGTCWCWPTIGAVMR